MITKMITISLALLTAHFSAEACLGDQSTSSKPMSVYVVPQLAASQLYSSWTPVLENIGKTTGVCFDLEIPATIPDFERVLLKGTPDFAFMNPYHQVMAHNAKGYIPLVADSKSKLRGVVVVKADSPIKSIYELNGKNIALPAPNSFAASLLVRALLEKQGVTVEPVFVKSHNNVYRSVIVGDIEAGAGVNYTFSREPIQVREQIRVIFDTPEFMPHPFSANPRVPEELRKKIIDTFFKMSQDAKGRALLDAVQIPKPVATSYAEDYEILEQLDLKKFVMNGAN